MTKEGYTMGNEKNSATFTDAEMASFLIHMNDIGMLAPYLSMTDEEIENAFATYHDVLAKETGQDEPLSCFDFVEKYYALTQYQDVLNALLQFSFNIQEPSEKEVSELEHFILNSMSDTKDYPELTEQEMENFLSIINGSPTDTTCYDTHELNSFSYIWKNSTLDVKVKEMQTKKRNSDSLKIRVGVALLWGGLAYMHFLDEAYLNAIGDISTLLLYQLIFNISEHETDNVKKYEKISYIFKWMMSCGLLSGLEQHHLTLLSGMFVGFYYVASRFFRNCAEVEKSYQKTR
mgnify:CR=1 FL=1|jgi:hypothetical protein